MAKVASNDNAVYKRAIKKNKNFCPFRKEFQMEVIESFFKKDLAQNKKLKVFEAASGQGRLLYYLNEFDSSPEYFGLDYVKEYIDYANKLFVDNKNIHCEQGDLYHLPAKYKNKFDITFLYKTLAWVPDYQKVLKQLFKITKSKIYITTLFSDNNFSYEIKIKNPALYTKGEYITYYILSLSEFKDTCKKLGAKKVSFHDIKIPFDLPRTKDPNVLQTRTIKMKNEERLEVTGMIVLNWKLIIIDL